MMVFYMMTCGVVDFTQDKRNIGNNFGTTLQACALYDYVSEINSDTTIINYRPKYSYNKGKFGQLVKKVLYFKDAMLQEKRYRESQKLRKNMGKICN